MSDDDAPTGDDPRVILMRWVDERIADARDIIAAEVDDAVDALRQEVAGALAEMKAEVDGQVAYLMGRIDMVGVMFRDEIDRASTRHPSGGKGKAKKSAEGE